MFIFESIFEEYYQINILKEGRGTKEEERN